ncbi:MAG: hypothetical protein BA871_17220 [Desulfuromonadales bacterium C00003096]|nr:MAG: hypothetical protein BA871_17220 [Desulfuromonadales bacterium C00003096]
MHWYFEGGQPAYGDIKCRPFAGSLEGSLAKHILNIAFCLFKGEAGRWQCFGLHFRGELAYHGL